jgi:hypothetical protein
VAATSSSVLLAVAAAAAVAYCSLTERLKVLLSMVGKTVEAKDAGGGGWWRALGLC